MPVFVHRLSLFIEPFIRIERILPREIRVAENKSKVPGMTNKTSLYRVAGEPVGPTLCHN